jgi:endonuclease/exonuclease/phosphatase family metal-dependent hydrolase
MYHKKLSRRKILKSLGITVVGGLLPKIVTAHPDISAGSSNITHKIVSANIRVDLPDDEKAGVGWSIRKDITSKILHVHKPDIICLQEVLKGQNEDMKKMFPNFQSLGFEGPEMDPIPTGYHGIAKNPIMFLKSKYELIAAGTYWLSETPHLGGSKSWDTGRARHVNWVRLLDKKEGKQFRVVNVHLDHLSQSAREKQTALLLEETTQYDSSFPQILAGDFNADASNNVINMIKNQDWIDSYIKVHGEGEPGFTGHGFKGKANVSKKGRIDFVFTRGLVTPTSASIIKDDIGGRYPSDHFFISTEVIIK